jgi:hypothetical protein
MEVRQTAMGKNEKAPAPRTRTRRTSREPARVRLADDQIRLRAYELYLRRNGHPGDPMDDWLRAERELIEEAPGARS